jgi:cytochrome c
MFSWRERSLLLAAFMIAAACPASAEEPGHYGYGVVATPAQIAGWNIDARGDDGAGLPPG